jgi:hypothetical protein
MSLNPSFDPEPSAKFSLNISAFNGNTTKVFVDRPSPKSSYVAPVQPITLGSNTTITKVNPGVMMAR